MNARANFPTWLIWTVVPLLSAGCWNDDETARGCPAGQICDSSTLTGAPAGVRADGTPDVTVEQAWPGRIADPIPLTAEEVAQACALLAACYPTECADAQCQAAARGQNFALCTLPELSFFWEERAVPSPGKNERWTFEARELLKTGGDCSRVLSTSTPRPQQVICEEAGCWWYSPTDPIPQVSCEGDVATLTSAGTTYQRDCARALQQCDERSATGCTDRAPVACQHPAKDRCDGNVRLGCDGNGRVSFHDCARLPGGTCKEREDGTLGCIAEHAGECDLEGPICDGDRMKVCVTGRMIDVDCSALGLAGCADGTCVAR